jgi:hypothetical protein
MMFLLPISAAATQRCVAEAGCRQRLQVSQEVPVGELQALPDALQMYAHVEPIFSNNQKQHGQLARSHVPWTHSWVIKCFCVLAFISLINKGPPILAILQTFCTGFID